MKQTNIFDFLVESMSDTIHTIVDSRKQRKNLKYSLHDIVLSAFSIFYFQNKSWLSFQRSAQTSKGLSNAQTMFSIKDIPSDNHIRKILDTITPKCFKMIYEKILLKIKSLGILKSFTYLDEYLLIALDGTYYHSSKNISCKCCQKRVDKETAEIHYFHSVITPTIVHPNHKKVIPLMQEFIDNSDGKDKQDCEINASKRWVDNFNNQTEKKLIMLGDDLYSREPMIQNILDKKHSYIFVAKPTSHKYLYEQIEMIRNLGTLDTKKQEKIVHGKKQITTYSYINDVMIKSSQGKKVQSLTTNWCEVIVTNVNGKKLYHNCFITNIPLHANNVADIIQAGRTRWKIENENNNTLKTKGYNLEHNFGHGQKNLSKILCSLNILAFLFHTVQELEDELYSELRDNIGSREQFFHGINFLTTMFNFKSFNHMIEFILKSRQTKENISMEPYIM
jgi:hypothetical protein